MKKIIFIFTVGFLFKSFAYIPPSEMILSRWVKHQGFRNYKVVQSVTISDHSTLKEPLKLTEEWWRFSDRLFLRVKEGSKTLFLFSYKDFNKYWIDSKRRKISGNRNYIENYFFLKIKEPEKEEPDIETPNEKKTPEWMSQVEDIRLERALGVVNYVFDLKKSTLWLEQDEFVLRKLKVDKDSWLTAHSYRLYPGRLFFPRKRIFKSPDLEVEMKVLSIQSMSVNTSKQARLKHIPKEEDNSLLNKFYYQIR